MTIDPVVKAAIQDDSQDRVAALSLPGDRDVALAMLSQVRNSRFPLDDVQVQHLLVIGFRAGAAAGRAEAIADLQDPKVLIGYDRWLEADGRIDDGSACILDARDFASVAAYLEAKGHQP